MSIPALFRALLKAESAKGSLGPTAGAPLVLRPSHNDQCIEVWSETAFEALSAPLAKLDEFSQEHDDLSITLFADAVPMEADKEGRVVLPANLVAQAGLSDQSAVVFMGRGKIFQIWDAALAERRKQEAQQRSREKRLTLPGAGG